MGTKGLKQSKEWVRKRVEGRRWYHPTEETIRRMSLAKSGSKNPFYGHKWTERQKALIPLSHIGKHTPETSREKISLSRRRYYGLHPEKRPTGINNPMYNKPVSGEMRNRLKNASVNFYNNHPEIRENLSVKYSGKNNPFYGRQHSAETKEIMKEKRKYRVMPLKDTQLERIIQYKLKAHGIDFKKHVPIYGQPDIFVEPNLCVFIDGCYWHACSVCEKGTKRNDYLVRRKIDGEINRRLEDQGYIVVRLWEHEIINDVDSCLSKIKSYKMN